MKRKETDVNSDKDCSQASKKGGGKGKKECKDKKNKNEETEDEYDDYEDTETGKDKTKTTRKPKNKGKDDNYDEYEDEYDYDGGTFGRHRFTKGTPRPRGKKPRRF
ncbi:hypothetical protein Y032_0273g1002 [Ancylostoma ceylanicum]|uniref:Uncharacterized protein n=1 Tax=Ancylostoma ceylanicum TaxID=53326 RepID=A0A016S7T8_9BILA|nr:hypothetical protein Y032_0273g1002 [Ancylostoma ceylanicum]